MKPRDVIRKAALAAARHALRELPKGLVRWDDESQVQAEAKWPQVTLSTVSLVPNDPPIERWLERADGLLLRTLWQEHNWSVQVKVEGWHPNACNNRDPFQFVRVMRNAWRLSAVLEVLTDADSPSEERTECKYFDDLGQILAVRTAVDGHTLPVYIYEVPILFGEYDSDDPAFDPPTDVIEHFDITGKLNDGTDDVTVHIVADKPS